MTCVVGIKKDNVVYIGADSSASSEGSDFILSRSDAKVFRVGSFIIGFSGSFRFGQIMRFSFKPPEHKSGKSDYAYMCSDFVTKLQSTLEKNRFNGQNDKTEMESSTELLVGYNRELYYVGQDYQIGINNDNYSAIGCSDVIALGALYAINNIKGTISAEKQIEIALDASTKYCSRVLRPYIIISSDKKYK